MNKYEARYRNACRWVKKINAVIDGGGVVYNRRGEKVNRFEIHENGDIYLPITDYMNIDIFINDVNYDEGMHTDIADFDRQFEGWTYVNKADIKKLEKEIGK